MASSATDISQEEGKKQTRVFRQCFVVSSWGGGVSGVRIHSSGRPPSCTLRSPPPPPTHQHARPRGPRRAARDGGLHGKRSQPRCWPVRLFSSAGPSPPSRPRHPLAGGPRVVLGALSPPAGTSHAPRARRTLLRRRSMSGHGSPQEIFGARVFQRRDTSFAAVSFPPPSRHRPRHRRPIRALTFAEHKELWFKTSVFATAFLVAPYTLYIRACSRRGARLASPHYFPPRRRARRAPHQRRPAPAPPSASRSVQGVGARALPQGELQPHEAAA